MILNEIGDLTAKRYRRRLVAGDPTLNKNGMYAKYNFVSDSGFLYTLLAMRYKDYLTISFTIEGDSQVITNKNEVYRVISTIHSISTFIFAVTDIAFKGIAYRIEFPNTKKGRQRDMLYKIFIRNFAKENVFDMIYRKGFRGMRYVTLY